MTDSDPKPKLRWWQFSLRKFMVVMTLFSVLSVMAYRFVEWGRELSNENRDLVLSWQNAASSASYLTKLKELNPDIATLELLFPELVEDPIGDEDIENFVLRKIRKASSDAQLFELQAHEFESKYWLPLYVYGIVEWLGNWLEENEYFLSADHLLYAVFWISASAFVVVVLVVAYRWFIRGNKSTCNK